MSLLQFIYSSDIERSSDLLLFYPMLKSLFPFVPQSSNMDAAKEEVVEASVPDSANTAFISLDNAKIESVAEKRVFKHADYQLSHNDNLDIVKFLARPYLTVNSSFATTDVVGTFTNYPWYTGLISSMIKEKVDGVFLIQATLVVTITFNANRFQAGRYILAWLPNGGIVDGSTPDNNWIAMHKYTKTNVTQLPHVEFDLNCDKTAQLRIPWAAANSSYLYSNGTPGYNNPGHYFLYPYSPLVTTAGTTAVGFNLFTHYEDVVLGGSTIPQSGLDVIANEQSKVGPITKGLRLGAEISASLSTIPLLSSIAAPASWVLDALSRAAHSFGWSKPTVLGAPHRVTSFPFPYMATADGHDNSEPLSMVSTNHVGVAAGFGGTDLDELSFDFIKSIPAWCFSASWTTGNAYGVQIFSLGLSPFGGNIVVNDGAVPLQTYTPAAWLGQIHQFYTGSINWTFKFVKTEFHTGRLLVSYVPEDAETAVPTHTTTTSAYVHRDIIDLSTGNEFTFNFPYISRTMWRETGDIIGRYGTVYVTVIDPLVAPATVATTVTILAEMSGGDDLQFAAPVGNPYSPCIPSAPQSGMEECNVCDKAIGSTVKQKKSMAPAENCMGETIQSYRQHLKRGGYAYTYEIKNAVSTYTSVAPFSWTPYVSNATVLSGAPSRDPFTQASSIYALNRGGVRLKFTPDSDAGNGALYLALQQIDRGSTAFSNAGTTLGAMSGTLWSQITNSLAQTYMTLNNGGHGIFVPQQESDHSRVSVANRCGSTGVMSYTNNPSARSIVYLFQPTTTAANVVGLLYHRSGADDISFGLWCGIPPMA